METNKESSRGFRVTDWKPIGMGCTIGSFRLSLPSGLVLRDVTLVEKNGERWVRMPTQKFVGGDGTIQRTPVVAFADQKAYERFQSAAMAAIEDYLLANEEK